jgi:hypothetical protein
MAPCNRKPSPGNSEPQGTSFTNWAQNFSITPNTIWEPKTLDEIVAIVQKAEAKGLKVHAFGTGWSFTGVMATPDYMAETRCLNGVPKPDINPPKGFDTPPLGHGSTNVIPPIVPRKKLTTLSETMTGTQYPNDSVFGALTPEALKCNLCHVESGIKIADLYTTLESIPANPPITTPDGFWHGYALKTLGGSGGQAIVGAITTGVHGGDDHDSNNNPIQPLPDMVKGIRMVGSGGVEYFIQRGGSRAIVDAGRLAELDPCLAGPGQIITNDEVFNAVVVSMGRMGFIYSVVLEVRPQYFLTETVTAGRWMQVSSAVMGQPVPSGMTIRDLRANRFLQVLILPYASYEQSQIGNNTTASTPFVVPDPNGGASWVYFQGTDNTLWKVRDDGNQQVQINGNTTASTPFVIPQGWVYFRGTDTGINNPFDPGSLWKVATDNDHSCAITVRNEVPPTIPVVAATSTGNLIFNFACELPPAALVAWMGAIIAGLIALTAGSAALLSLIPIIGPILAGIDVAAATTIIALLSPLLVPGTTIGDYLAAAENVLTQIGQFDLAASIVNQILSSFQSPGPPRTDVSFRIMDTTDYRANCFKSLSLEVAFNADDTAYIDYISAVFNLINKFASQKILTGAYISLRYCGGSDALLAMEQWPHTVCIEIAGLAHLSQETQVLKAFEDETANHVGADGKLPTVHWGQLNSRTRAQVDAIFGKKIHRWRSVLARLSSKGNPFTFDNEFCQHHGLETYGVKPGADVSYLDLLLENSRGKDISYLEQLLLSQNMKKRRDAPYLYPLLLT